MSDTPLDPKITAIVGGVSNSNVLSLLVGGGVFMLFVVALTWFCYRIRYHRSLHAKRYSAEQPFALHTVTRKPPKAVKSPAGAATTHYLKKSPSPPGAAAPHTTTKSSPNSSNPHTPTPLTNDPDEKDVAIKEVSIFSTENELQPTTPKECPTGGSLANTENASDDGSGYLGQLVFKLRYKKEKSALIVTVVRCRDLPARDSSSGSSDPYVKLQLLPDKQHKVKTRVLRKTRNPVYDEDFTFYGIQLNQLHNMTLHFVVLSFDRYSRDDIIGEVFSALSSVDSAQLESQQVALCRDILPRSARSKSQGRGELLVSLSWQPAAHCLGVVILKARNVPKMDVTGLADPYVKMYLLHKGKRILKKKTHVKKRTLNPVFNESFFLQIPPEEESLDNFALEFILVDWDRVTKNEIIGRLEMGGSNCTGTALNHWKEICNSPRRQIADWHKLKE